jgi:hypothetical protein
LLADQVHEAARPQPGYFVSRGPLGHPHQVRSENDAAGVAAPVFRVEAGVRHLFHDPSRVPADNFRAAADDVLRSLREPGYRMATATCARNLGAERHRGRAA